MVSIDNVLRNIKQETESLLLFVREKLQKAVNNHRPSSATK